jgi:hypothetical protein
VPIIAWVTGGASSIIRLFGPESMGGLGDFGGRIDAEAQRTGEDPLVIGDKARVYYVFGYDGSDALQIFRHTDGSVINISGLPPMYDYEFFPQKVQFTATFPVRS